MKRLARTKERKIAGVCGGIAQYLGTDPTLVRIIYLLVTIFSAGFPGVAVYLILWFVIPPEDAVS